MEIIKLTKDKYKEWDEFCLASDDAWFWHTTGWLEYNLNYRTDLNPQSFSFFGIDNGQIIAACSLILEDYDGRKEFSFGAIPNMVPVFANNLLDTTKKKAMKAVFKEIDRLAKEHNVKKASFRFPVLNKSYLEGNMPQNNYLVQFGYLDTSINTQVNVLKEKTKKLSYQADRNIKKSLKILKIEIFDRNNINREIFNKYTELHHKAAERITRPSFTFNIMYDWIKEGDAFLVGAMKGDEYFGFSYFYLYKNNVYYGSGCNDPEFIESPVAHLIHYKAMGWMKKNRYKFYEIGWQNDFSSLSNCPTLKDVNISRFKHDFGGYTVPLFMGEKYYDKNYFLKVYQERINKYADLIE